uniref:Uncharacterized protein n=1 Tax=viral metagenome TaxID=1070528 RepID=A0A6C0DFK2_9ZZZZ
MSQYVYKLNEIPGFHDVILNKNPNNLFKKIINITETKTKNNQEYKIISYDSAYLIHEYILTFGVFRSVVINSMNEVVSFFPPKKMKFTDFHKRNPDFSQLYIQEFVEGISINLFWDPSIGFTGGWEIASLDDVGCHVLYSVEENKSLRDIFIDVINAKNVDIDLLEKRYCYHFIIQHPVFGLIKHMEEPEVFLINIFEIVNTGDRTVNVFTVDIDTSSMKENPNFTHLKFPKKYSLSSYQQLNDDFTSIPYTTMGIHFTDKNGRQCKLINPNYEYVKYIKDSNMFDIDIFREQYIYLSLRKEEGKVVDYLINHYLSRKHFLFFKKHLYLFTHTLYLNYIYCYVKKAFKLSEYSDIYQLHLKLIHQIYISELKPSKENIKKKTVIDYVNTLSPEMLMYLLNYQYFDSNVLSL